MIEIVFDTDMFAELLAQYFDNEGGNRGIGRFVAGNKLSGDLARRVNTVVELYQATGDISVSGVLIVSSLAFVELARKFEEISIGRFIPENLSDFLRDPPEWFLIAPLDCDLLPFFVDVPKYVSVRGRMRPMEWTDSVHVATALSRGDGSMIATSDEKIRAIQILSNRIL